MNPNMITFSLVFYLAINLGRLSCTFIFHVKSFTAVPFDADDSNTGKNCVAT